jgi:diadenosine tetraphosphate (Ap4A) HIT family hydrolase
MHTALSSYALVGIVVSAFNVGMNAGRSAGQTVFYCHIHPIPRRHGDVADLRAAFAISSRDRALRKRLSILRSVD